MEGTGGKSAAIGMPFTCEFTIKRDTLSSANTGNFRIYNLSEKTRMFLFHDQYDLAPANQRAIQFRAGYTGNSAKFNINTLPMMFNGQVMKCFSYREKETFYTDIEARDAGISTTAGYTSMSLGMNAQQKDCINRTANDITGISKNHLIGDFQKTFRRGFVACGNSWEIMKTLTDNQCFIDNMQMKILHPWEALTGTVKVISADTGLLSTPRRTQATLELDILFEPGLTVGQQVQLVSMTNKAMNGQYKVSGFTHTGTISPAVGGVCKTNVQLWIGEQALQLVKGDSVK